MQKIQTSKFIFSKQAKRLPEIIPLDEELAYILGLWKADRCSTAKGIVGLKNKDEELLKVFRNFIEKIKLEVKERTVEGYGQTKEVYCCSMPLRRIFEYVSANRVKIFSNKQLILSYLAGIIDGDGSGGDNSHLVIFYSRDEMEEVEKDSQLIKKLGFDTTIKIKSNHIRLYVLKPSQLIRNLWPFILLKRKFMAA
jgi:intein/homing endonuclease